MTTNKRPSSTKLIKVDLPSNKSKSRKSLLVDDLLDSIPDVLSLLFEFARVRLKDQKQALPEIKTLAEKLSSIP